MDTIPGSEPMENLPHSPLGGLDPANLLKQGAAEDTLMDGTTSAFNPPSLEELSAIFPQFEILELIGQGGMGAVYKVRQKDLDRIVALKILPPAIGQSPEFAARFTREAKALGKLNHPGIVTLHEFGQQEGLYFILMEFVDGVNLAQLMKSGRISPREALAIVPQICEALQFAHDQGIVHRDIKPENLLLDRLGRVKIADFGIAKVVAAVCDHPAEEEGNQRRSQIDATLAGKIIGTPQYMAPEQVSHPSEVDHLADIYALGVVFYQMLTGELPGKCLEAPSKKVHIDVRLDEIVLRAMEKEPKMRYQTAHEFQTVVHGVQTPVHALSPSLPLAPPKRGILRRWWWVFLVILPLGLLIGLAAASVLTHFTPKKYEVSATIEVKPAEGLAMPPDILRSQIKALKSKKTLEAVAEQLELPKKWMLSQDAVVQRLLDISTTQNIRGTDLISIGVRHTDPQEGVAIVRLLAQNYQRNFPGEVVIHEEPSEPNAPSSPNVRLNHAIGALLGLTLSPFLAIILIAILQRLFPETKSMNSPNLGRVNRSGPAVKKFSTLSVILLVVFSILTLIPAIVGTAAFFWYQLSEPRTVNHLSSENGDAPISTSSRVTNASDRLDMQVDPPLLMTEFGEFKSEQSPWSIRVSAQDRTLHISRQPDAGGIGIRVSPEKWRAQNGWFAFIEDQTHAWAYDGDGKLELMEVTPEKSTVYETETINRRVPEAIISRITQATREKIGIEADKNEGAKALLKAQGEAPVQIPLKKNYQQVFTSYSPDRVILASLTPWGFIADVPESFELTPQNAWVENLKKIPDVDIHDDVGSSGMSGLMLRKNNHGAQAHQGFIQDFARINFFSEFKDDSFHFRGEIKEGEDSRLTEVQGSLAIDERMVVKLGSVPKKRLRYLVFWVTCATDHVKKSPEQMDKDREHALEWLGLLDRGDYSKASATAMDDSLFLGLNEVEWSVALTKIRKPRGAVISRVFKTALEPGGIVGAQSGEYRLMQFKTEFADGTKAVESITFYKDRDYTWKAVGYFIDPASGAKIPLAERLGGPEIGVLAGTWLAGIDAEKYSQSWKDTAQFFQKAITEGGWSDALTKFRKPLGEMKSRKLLEAKSTKSLPGAPDGEYVVMQFDTSFAVKGKAVETVTFMLEKDGLWKAVGYFIR